MEYRLPGPRLSGTQPVWRLRFTYVHFIAWEVQRCPQLAPMLNEPSPMDMVWFPLLNSVRLVPNSSRYRMILASASPLQHTSRPPTAKRFVNSSLFHLPHELIFLRLHRTVSSKHILNILYGPYHLKVSSIEM